MGIAPFLGGCAATPSNTRQTYVVRAHDTVYSIAWRHAVDYRDLARWNHIGPDYRLLVGQVLVLQPEGGGTSRRTASGARVMGAAAMPPGGVAAQESAATAARAGGVAAREPPTNAERAGRGWSSAGETQWLWPTAHASPPRPVPGGGILLFGRLGQDVRAAAGGRVVYTGNGIRGYGNLIIIKHGENWLSSYAHNRELLVHEGENVAMGQTIAHMGMAAHRACALYFEIRLNGKPVDPLRYLPAAK